MKTLENKDEIANYILINFKHNLNKLNTHTLSEMLEKIDLNVCAKTKDANLNKLFNELICTLKNIPTNNVTMWNVTKFYYYYQLLKKIKT